VIISPDGLFAYVSVVDVDGDEDYIVQYSAIVFEELDRAAVGDDPHLSVTARTPYLYAPCQGGDAVYVLNRFSMDEVEVIDIPGAHGAGMTLSGRYFYTANLSGGGEDALWVINTRTLEIVGGPIDAPYTVPHNIVLTPNGRKLYLTHSGPNDKVTIYATSNGHPEPELIGEVTVGMNPFGLDYVP
jgi:DNA-binding beta-propeller fold protein YncE